MEQLTLACRKEPHLETVLCIKGPSGHGDVELFFHQLDLLGEGEVSFSDFVFGLLKHRATRRNVDQLVFDHQFTKIVRYNAFTCRSAAELTAFMKEHATELQVVSSMLKQQRTSHSADLSTARGEVAALQRKVDRVIAWLNIPSAMGQRTTQTLQLQEAAASKELLAMMSTLLAAVTAASSAAKQQAASAAQVLDGVAAGFKSQVEAEADRQIVVLKERGATCVSAAASAARAAAASAAIATGHAGQMSRAASSSPSSPGRLPVVAREPLTSGQLKTASLSPSFSHEDEL